MSGNDWDSSKWPSQGWDEPIIRPRRRILPVTMIVIAAAAVAVAAVWLLPMLRSSASPVSAAQAWAEAVTGFDGERIADLSCLNAPVPAQIVMQLFGALKEGGATIPLPDDWTEQLERLLPRLAEYITLDAGQLQYGLLSSTASEARVHASGPLRVGVWRIFFPVELDQTWEMQQEDGLWKWCGWDN